MGILTSDPYENAWIIVGLGLAGLIVSSILGGGVFYYFKDKIPTLEELICTGAILISALIPLGLFSSGIFIDFINQSYNYSTASIVGFFGALATKLFGSTTFADFSKKIVGAFPSIYKASDVPGVPSDWNWWMIIIYLLVAAAIAVPAGLSFGMSGIQTGELITIGVVVPFVLFLLAGNGLMGNFSPPGQAGGSAFSINPHPQGLCDVPGFTWAANPFAPVSIVLTQTIMWYHMIKDWSTGNANHTALVGSGSLLMFALQWFALAKNGCLESYKAGVYSPLISLLISITVAGASYGVVKNIPASTSGSGGTPGIPANIGPSIGPIPPIPGKGCPPGFTLEYDGMCHVRPVSGEKIAVGGGQQKTSAPVDEDQDAFVCEAYKDGELVTSTIVE